MDSNVTTALITASATTLVAITAPLSNNKRLDDMNKRIDDLNKRR